jgi:hypothetical protein
MNKDVIVLMHTKNKVGQIVAANEELEEKVTEDVASLEQVTKLFQTLL